MIFEQEYDVLNWICEQSQYPLVYTLLRYGNLFHYPESKVFKACIALADILRDKPDTISRLLHHHDWRNQVIGNMVVVLNRDNRFELDYVEKLKSEEVHFPEPLAAGWGVTATNATILNMNKYLNDLVEHYIEREFSLRESSALSIYAALRALDSPQVKQFEASSLFTFLKSTSFFPHTIEKTEKNYKAYKGFHATG